MTKKHPVTAVDFSEKSTKEIIQAVINIQQSVKYQEEGKTIAVAKLPDCTFKRMLVEMVINPNEAKICVVAKLFSSDNTWLAYAGYPDIRDVKPLVKDYAVDIHWLCETVRDRDGVLLMGQILRERVARQLFPDWSGKAYAKYNDPPALLK